MLAMPDDGMRTTYHEEDDKIHVKYSEDAPTSIPANSTLLVEFYWDSASMVGKDSWVY